MMTGWEKFTFNIHSPVALLFSLGCLYIIGTKVEDKLYETWWGKLIIFLLELPFLFFLSFLFLQSSIRLYRKLEGFKNEIQRFSLLDTSRP